jgi:excinuclease ABC subunit B
MTTAIKHAIEETDRRRKLQAGYNRRHHITPTTIKKSLRDVFTSVYEADYYTVPVTAEETEEFLTVEDITRRIESLEEEMKCAARDLEFERAAELRDRIRALRQQELAWR